MWVKVDTGHHLPLPVEELPLCQVVHPIVLKLTLLINSVVNIQGILDC